MQIGPFSKCILSLCAVDDIVAHAHLQTIAAAQLVTYRLSTSNFHSQHPLHNCVVVQCDGIACDCQFPLAIYSLTLHTGSAAEAAWRTDRNGK